VIDSLTFEITSQAIQRLYKVAKPLFLGL